MSTVIVKVVLLDDSEIEIPVQVRLITSDFRDIVTSQVNIRETQYFGLSYVDENGYQHWLQEDRRVLDHDFPRRAGSNKPPLLHLGVKYYVESISSLTASITYEQYFLQARKLIAKGELECDCETVFYLGALAVQVSHGDFVSDTETRSKLRKMPLLPLRVLKQHPSLEFCEGKVMEHYQTMKGMPKGDAMLEYLEMIQRLPSYGVHFFEVKSSAGIPWWLGIGNNGICIYDHNDRRTPRESFSWERIENFFYRDKKFSLIVLDPKRISASRRSFVPGNTKTHVWHAMTPLLARTIYSMAEATKHFCMDVMEKRNQKNQQSSAAGRVDISYEITHRRHSFCRPVHSASTCIVRPPIGSSATIDRHRSVHPLCNTASNSRSHGSLHTMSSGVLDSSVIGGSDSANTSMIEELAVQHLQEDTLRRTSTDGGDPPVFEELSEEAKKEVFQKMKERYDQLEEKKQGLIKLFEQKLEELKDVCMQEAAFTGELPEEYPLLPHEKPPTVRRRVGTAFTLSPHLVNTPQSPSHLGDGTPLLPPRLHAPVGTPYSDTSGMNLDGLSCGTPTSADGEGNLSVEFELQKQIVCAKLRLAQEKTASKSVRKQRKDDLKKAREKLEQLRQRLNMRKCSLDSSMMTLSRTTSSRGSLDDHASAYQMSLTGSSSEVLHEDDQHYNTVSGVHGYPSPNITARRRKLGHSRGSLPEFNAPPGPHDHSGISDEFRRDSYASQKSLPVTASLSRARTASHSVNSPKAATLAARQRHHRSQHCSPARARPAVGAHMDGPLPDRAGPRANPEAGVVHSPPQNCDSGFVSLHTPSNSQKYLTANSAGAIATSMGSGSLELCSGLDLSPVSNRRQLLLYHNHIPLRASPHHLHHLSNSDSQLTGAVSGDDFGPSSSTLTRANRNAVDPTADNPPPPKTYWYQPPSGELGFVSVKGDDQNGSEAAAGASGTTQPFRYIPSEAQTLEPSELACAVGAVTTTTSVTVSGPGVAKESGGGGAGVFVPPPPVEFEKPLETADCLQYSEEVRRRQAACAAAAAAAGSDLDRR